MRVTAALVLLLAMATGSGVAHAQDAPRTVVPLDEFSPVFLGMYRKLMLIEDDIRRHAQTYGVDFDLARAVCLYESGGNADLTSHAGARGYFQVMPATFRELRVTTNLEAGVKYLSQLIRQFGREDRAIAAYNGGPGRISRSGALPLETLQYVLGVGHYRTILKQYDASLRHHATGIDLVTAEAGDDWTRLSQAIGVPEWELRLHNAFLSGRRLRAGDLVAYPVEPRPNLLHAAGNVVEYLTRLGDNYLKLAITLGIEPDAMRAANSIWHLQTIPAGMLLSIPFAADRSGVLHAAFGLTPEDGGRRAAAADAPEVDEVLHAVARTPPAAPQRASTIASTPTVHRVARGDTLGGIARRYNTTMAAIQRANDMGARTTVRLDERLRIPRSGSPQADADAGPRIVTHRVVRGDTLIGLASRHNTTVGAIQAASGLGRRTDIRIGERLRIPAR